MGHVTLQFHAFVVGTEGIRTDSDGDYLEGEVDFDAVVDGVPHRGLVAKVKHAIESDPVDLIERLAQRIADVCLQDARVSDVEVTVHKPHAPIQATFEDVALTINRSRK